MMKLLNSLGARPSSQKLAQDNVPLTRFPTHLKPSYSRQPVSKKTQRVPSASVPREKPQASVQVALSNDAYGQTGVPVDVLRNALPMRFARMDASERDEFVFQ